MVLWEYRIIILTKVFYKTVLATKSGDHMLSAGDFTEVKENSRPYLYCKEAKKLSKIIILNSKKKFPGAKLLFTYMMAIDQA